MSFIENQETIEVEFCDEHYSLSIGSEFTIGRDGHLRLDDNPYLHRKFLVIAHEHSIWWLKNQGSRLSATISDWEGLMQAWLAPGSAIPIIFKATRILTTAGPTTYEINVFNSKPQFENSLNFESTNLSGTTTLGEVLLTPEHKLLLVALCEPLLNTSNVLKGEIPTSAKAAERLGWSIKKFERKLDNVCYKFQLNGVKGLYGSKDNIARHRKVRLVEYALSSRIVSTADLDLLR